MKKLKSGRFLLVVLLSHMLINILSNVIAVLAISPLTLLVSSPEYTRIDRFLDQETLAGIISQVLPFPLIVLIILFVMSPVWKIVFAGTDGSGVVDGTQGQGTRKHKNQYFDQTNLGEKPIRRLLNSPMTYSLITILGWVIGSAAYFIVGAFFYGVELPLGYMLESNIVIIILAGLTFVINYYAIEFFNRRVLFPRLSPEADYLRWKGVHRTGLRKRMFILLVSISLLPLLITGQMLFILNQGGENVLGRDLTLELLGMFAIILVSVVTITLLKASAIVEPVQELSKVTREIQEGDFSATALVTGTDDLGVLTRDVNLMAQGLQERELIKETFGKMVAPQVRDALIQQPVELGGEERKAAVLFLDIAGFTSLSEDRQPGEIVGWLNRLFELTNKAVDAHKGIVNKYIGDAVMAIFGAPLALDRPGAQALGAARDILKMLPELNAQFVRDGLPQVEIRCGIHVGQVLAGNLGSSDRMEYTVIGDVVNTASRLEGACKDYGVSLLFSQEVLEDSGVQALAQGSIQLRGKAKALDVYTLHEGPSSPSEP